MALFDLGNNRVMRRNLGKRQRCGRAAQPVEMLGEFENAAVVQSQAFLHRVAALHDGIKWTDAGFVAMNELAVDVDEKVAVAFVESLEH